MNEVIAAIVLHVVTSMVVPQTKFKSAVRRRKRVSGSQCPMVESRNGSLAKAAKKTSRGFEFVETAMKPAKC